ncbi:MAG TPA: capsule assembly Wzi family protein [Bryobacteraceae bacterium]|nr:capsule assembly Wzi family protein [Bryobacteraceae bacterium]
MFFRGHTIVLGSCLLMAAELLGVDAYGQQEMQSQVQLQSQQHAQSGQGTTSGIENDKEGSNGSGQAGGAGDEPLPGDQFTETKLGLSLLKNIVLDQKAVWTSPAHLRLVDANWIIPFGAIAAASLESDTHVSRALTHSPSRVSKSSTFSNYGIAAFGGATGGLYVLGKLTHDDHQQETALLAGEAAVNAVGVTTALQYAFGRQRPLDGTGEGSFWHGGTSFPSDHSTAAWAVASVLAHEYPGPLTKILAYGLASAVSVSRVTGKDHFPTDVLVGGAIGYFMGQYVYRAHHDPDLGGGSWETFKEAHESEVRDSKNTGSPYVPLDSWVYPAIERLAALGYIHSAFLDMRPWTRVESASLVQEAGEEIGAEEASSGEGDRLYAALKSEFQREFDVLSGNAPERSIQLESLYTNATEITGRPLNDSYHFGQTIIDNFGRPYQEGFNTDDGFSGYATTGRYTIYVRGEFQHAPSAPAFPLAARQAIASADSNPLQPATPFATVNQFTLQDTYVSANVAGWDLSIGKQSLWWGRGIGGALLYSDNAEPIYMFRAAPSEAFELPWVLSWLGPMKTDFFFGQLAGNRFPPRPLIHGVKISFKRTRNLEMSFVFTSEFGGVGRALTLAAIVNSFFSVSSSDLHGPFNNPGKRTLGFDFEYKFPHIRNWLTLYANGLLPEANITNSDTSTSPIYVPRRSAIRSGIYMPRLPGLTKLDFRVESSYTDPPTPRSVNGQYDYWNDFYHDLYTNKGNLIGDWVGREGMGFQGWSNYWISPRSSVTVGYRHAKVSGDFIPGGETLNDGSVKVSWQVRPDMNVSTSVQYEKWTAPILASTPQTNVTSSVQIEFFPHSWRW